MQAQEARVRTSHGTMDLFKTGKAVHQDCKLSPCLFNLYAENIMQNMRLGETQAAINIARRISNNLISDLKGGICMLLVQNELSVTTTTF